MATVTTTFPTYDRSIPSSSVKIHTTDSKQNPSFFTDSTNPGAPRVTHFLDDMDLLTLKRQYANIDLFEQSTLSNSTEDLSQLDRTPYQFEIFDQDPNDVDDYDLPYDDNNGYDYNIVIQERLKKANEEFEHDRTPAEVKHHQRVSFDAVVKAVDIIQDSNEHEITNSSIRPCISPVSEESSTNINSPRSETNAHEYTVPLNDTQPKSGPTLTEQIKALQFHNTIPTDGRWATTPDNSSNGEENSSKKSMVVSVNGQFDLKDEDDYTAKHDPKLTTNETNKVTFFPTPPKEPKQKQDSSHRPFLIRPKSSDSGKRDETNSTQQANRQRPKSATVSKTVETHTDKPSSGVDFDELLRKAREKRREELREERRKKEEEEEKRKEDAAKAKEAFERWKHDKDAERKRIIEEKRLEKEEHEACQAKQIKVLTELREKAFNEWKARKEHEATIINEFKKLKADEEMASEGSTTSINDHRAFQRWLRKKYEQSREEKRQLRLEAKRQRRLHRRSLKRKQLQQDLQLAKTFGYS